MARTKQSEIERKKALADKKIRKSVNHNKELKKNKTTIKKNELNNSKDKKSNQPPQ